MKQAGAQHKSINSHYTCMQGALYVLSSCVLVTECFSIPDSRIGSQH